MDNQNLDETSIDYQVMCSICNKPSIDSRCLPCGHSFCGQCIERWIEENHTSCPICSQAVPMRNLLEVDRVVREKVNDLPVKPYENEQTTLHNHSTNDDRNIVSSAIDEHSLFSDMTRQRNEQEGQSSTALHFEPLRAILSELILQNKQLKEQIKQFEKQNQNLTKKNEELHIEIAQLKKQSIEHKTRLNQLETNDQNYNTKILEIDQRHNLLERNIKSVKHRVTNLTNIKWKQQGISVAGGNGDGNKLNQLAYPKGIFIDDDQTIYIADCGNDRIVEWKSNANNGRVVVGGNEIGDQTNQLMHPADVIIDVKNDCFIIAAYKNRTVMRWSRQNNTNGEIIIDDIACVGLTMDNNGYLYVSDFQKHEVRRRKIGDENGTIVAGGNGQGNHLNQLNKPSYIFVDQDYSLYISDSGNDRVMKWLKDATEGIVVAGGNGKGNSLSQLSGPRGVIIDRFGQIYVADHLNHRVMRWFVGDTEGTIVVGGNGQGREANQLTFPVGLSFDKERNLYVADGRNHRIQKFKII